MPISGAVTGALKAVIFDKGFQEDRSIAIHGLPVVGHYPGDLPQDHGREIARLNPRQDQKAGIVENQVQPTLALSVIPADEAVALKPSASIGCCAE